jgi:uncharacterized membrane protein
VRGAGRRQPLPPRLFRIRRQTPLDRPVTDPGQPRFLKNPQAVELADRLDDPRQHQLPEHRVPARRLLEPQHPVRVLQRIQQVSHPRGRDRQRAAASGLKAKVKLQLPDRARKPGQGSAYPPTGVMCPGCRAGSLDLSSWICLDQRETKDMAKPESVFIYIGTYPDEAQARDDYQVVKDLHSAGAVGTYDAAVVTKDDKGKVHVNKDEMATRHGAWGGAAAGAVVGLLFPPSIIGTAVVGAAVGGVSGHLWRGMSRADVKELGELIDTGQAALVVVGESKVEQALNKAALKAEKHIAKQLNVSPKDVDAAVREAAGDVR